MWFSSGIPPRRSLNGHLSPFTADLVEYNCAEQFMVASKARLFGDDTALSAILVSTDPRKQKRLGRQVRHFDPVLWQDECEAIVLGGNPANSLKPKRCVLPCLLYTSPSPRDS